MGIDINGKVALITGGAQGMGLGIAKKFLNAKAKVAICARNSQLLREITDGLKDSFGDENVHGIFADVSLIDDIKRMVAETVRKFDSIDILVNNAGTNALHLFWEMPVEEWDMVFNTNLRGTMICTQEVVKIMLEKGVKGRIINISSINGQIPTTGVPAYCSSKAGLDMFTKVAALELGPHGINVNAVAPGLTITPHAEAAFNLPNFKEAALARTPKGRYADPEDIARVVLFLASEYADWVTGQVINADGGVSLIGVPKYYEEFIKNF